MVIILINLAAAARVAADSAAGCWPLQLFRKIKNCELFTKNFIDEKNVYSKIRLHNFFISSSKSSRRMVTNGLTSD